MIPVSSSWIDAVEYDAATATLRVRFKDKQGRITGTATYDNVDPVRGLGLLEAGSKGTYFHASGLIRRPYKWQGA